MRRGLRSFKTHTRIVDEESIMTARPLQRCALGIAVITVVASADIALGQINGWLADPVGNWFVPANWSAGVPTSTTEAQINNGGTARLFDPGARALHLRMGVGSGNSGTFEISGGEATFSGIYPGWGGTGILRVQNGGSLTTGFGNIGLYSGSIGTATIEGANSKWNIDLILYVGSEGNGTLRILNGSVVANQASSIIGWASTGTATVDGSGSRWTNGSSLTIGDSGMGALDITNGGVVTSVNGLVGLQAGSNGSVTVDGAESDWDNSGVLHIGSVGTGMVTVSDGGELRANSEILVNRFAAGNGTLFVTGNGSEAYTEGELRVADEGVGLLRIENGGTVANGTNAYLGRNAPTADGTAIITGAGSSWSIFQSLFVGGAGKGTLTVADLGTVSAAGGVLVGPRGTIDGDGTIFGNVLVEGVVAPGTSPGTLHVIGQQYAHNPGGKLQIELASATSFDRLDVSGHVALDGALEVSLLGGYVPRGGASFDIVDWVTTSGAFNAVNLPPLPAPLGWDTSQLYTTGVVSVTGAAPMFEADFDEDGDVDGNDLTNWIAGFGTAGGAAHMQGDADGDADVDGADFLTWQRQLGSGSAGASLSQAGVPEPKTGRLLTVLAAMTVAVRRQTKVHAA
jgi:T5SS/PEP-CTERM-associated repeat protein